MNINEHTLYLTEPILTAQNLLKNQNMRPYMVNIDSQQIL